MSSLNWTPVDEICSTDKETPRNSQWDWAVSGHQELFFFLMVFSFKIVVSHGAWPDFPCEDFMNCCTSLQFLKSWNRQNSSYLKAYTYSWDTAAAAAMDGWVLYEWLETILCTLDLYLTNLRWTYTGCLFKHNSFILLTFKWILELNINF